ncbi:hypothetical protein [Nitrosopumilus sp.]|uniref:hypothetical protein n=1 Tax=Nitrosopumilus sp. TaxID=2024843 RepID=UPI00349FF5E4
MENKANSSQGLKNEEIILKELLAKSLVVFIGVGVVSGFIFGAYLIDVKNTTQLIFVDGPSISIVTEKSDFKKDELIQIHIVNSGTMPLTFSDDSYGLKITGLSGILIYSPNATGSPSNLAPGNEIIFSWNQIKNDGNASLEGLYKISAKGIDNDGNVVEKFTTITILK